MIRLSLSITVGLLMPAFLFGVDFGRSDPFGVLASCMLQYIHQGTIDSEHFSDIHATCLTSILFAFISNSIPYSTLPLFVCPSFHCFAALLFYLRPHRCLSPPFLSHAPEHLFADPLLCVSLSRSFLLHPLSLCLQSDL